MNLIKCIQVHRLNKLPMNILSVTVHRWKDAPADQPRRAWLDVSSGVAARSVGQPSLQSRRSSTRRIMRCFTATGNASTSQPLAHALAHGNKDITARYRPAPIQTAPRLPMHSTLSTYIGTAVLSAYVIALPHRWPSRRTAFHRIKDQRRFRVGRRRAVYLPSAIRKGSATSRVSKDALIDRRRTSTRASSFWSNASGRCIWRHYLRRHFTPPPFFSPLFFIINAHTRNGNVKRSMTCGWSMTSEGNTLASGQWTRVALSRSEVAPRWRKERRDAKPGQEGYKKTSAGITGQRV